MRKKVAVALVAAAVLVVAGAAIAYFGFSDPPSGGPDTELAGVSVETGEPEAGTSPATTPKRKAKKGPPERCWPFFGGDPQRSLSRLDIRLGRPRRVVWMRKLRDLMEYPPTLCDGRVYVNLEHSGRTMALDARTGRTLWTRRTRGPLASSPAVWESVVVVSSHDGSVTGYETANGRRRWRIRIPAKVESSPVVIDGTAYFGTTHGRVFAVNVRTGAIRWAYDTGGRINASTSVWGDRLCVSTYAGSIFCLNRKNGRKIWSTYIKRDAFRYESFYASPSTDGARVYTTARTGKVVALSASSGNVRWTYHLGALAYATPALGRDRVFVGAFDGELTALEKTSGKPLWTASVPGRILAPAMVTGNLVFFSTLDGDTYAARASDGKIVWHRARGKYAPGIVSDRRYYLSLNRRLIAMRGERSPKERG